MEKVDKNIKIALISLLGTMIGTFSGIIMSTTLTNYRIEQLEIKVDKHNMIVERLYIVENKVSNLEKERDFK